MNIALITVATGPTYRDYAQGMFNSARKYFPAHDQFVFTDEPEKMSVTWGDQKRYCVRIPSHGYPEATLFRYKFLNSASWALRYYDQIFYTDADMEFVASIDAGDISSYDLTATLHPGYYGKKGTPETRRESLAFCDYNEAYYAGGFQGGRAVAYLQAAKILGERIKQDLDNGISAVWHDESHWNKYIADNKREIDVRVLTPSYCYPEDYNGGYGWSPEQFPPVLVALDKTKRGNHPRVK